MNQKAIIVINWMAFLLLTPATIILGWKMISEKIKGKVASSELIGLGLLLRVSISGCRATEHRRSWLA